MVLKLPIDRSSLNVCILRRAVSDLCTQLGAYFRGLPRNQLETTPDYQTICEQVPNALISKESGGESQKHLISIGTRSSKHHSTKEHQIDAPGTISIRALRHATNQPNQWHTSQYSMHILKIERTIDTNRINIPIQEKKLTDRGKNECYRPTDWG